MDESHQSHAPTGPRSATARRLRLVFTILVSLFIVTMAIATAGMVEIHDSLHAVQENAERAQRVLDAGGAAADAYARAGRGTATPPALKSFERTSATSLEEIRSLAAVADPSAQVKLREMEGLLFAVAKRGRALHAARRRGDIDGARTVEAATGPELRQLHRTTVAVASAFHDAGGRHEEHAEVVEHRTFRWAVALLALCVFWAVGAAVWIRRSVMRPMAQLSQAAQDLGADLTTRIQMDGDDEFALLARRLDEMAAEIQHRQEVHVRTENLAAVGRLGAGIAHELNNPLGVILGHVRLMKKAPRGAEDLEDLLVIEDETLRCQEIVEGLLDIARQHDGSRQTIHLRPMVDDVVARLTDAGIVGSVVVRVEGDAVATVHAGRLRQVVTNLLQNAIEAVGGHNGSVAVIIEAGATELLMRFIDDGPGIGPRARARLFEPFFTTKPAGTGLGLAISRAIIAAHHGSLEVVPRDEGAEFAVRLPTPAELV